MSWGAEFGVGTCHSLTVISSTWAWASIVAVGKIKRITMEVVAARFNL